MGPHYLTKLFKPSSVAVFGASDRPESVGANALANLITAGFKGPIYPINPKHQMVQNQVCYATIDAAPGVPDLVVIATPAKTIPAIIQACGEVGVSNAVILSAGFEDAEGKIFQQTVTETAKRYGMRLIGPNCLGIMRPEIGLNATFSKNQAIPGSLALVSQSGAICTAVLDWAEANGVGFSQVVSTGDAADVDFGEILDFLALDPNTKSILLYIEGITHSRHFMSGLKAAARIKPVVLLKSGRMPEGRKAAISHTGAIVGGDEVFSSAIERAGAVRAQSISQLFSAAKSLSYNIKIKNNRLVILTNGGGPGVMAIDRASELGLKMPDISPESMAQLDSFLPNHWSHNNPIDILGDATSDRYVQALAVCEKDPNYDGTLILLTPQAMSDPTAIAQSIIQFTKDNPNHKPIFTAWLGQSLVQEARDLFSAAKIPTFNTPESAVEAFSFIANYHQNQALLMQSPATANQCCQVTDVMGARAIINAVLAEGRSILSSAETRTVMNAFGIPITAAIEASTAEQAVAAADAMGYPVSIKINSPDLTHKSDVGGVKLNLHDSESVSVEFTSMVNRITAAQPEANIPGVTVEPMFKGSNARELLVGVMRDPVFGPTITFGSGGTAVEVLKDTAVALPPLNHYIANQMISRTKISQMLKEFRGQPAADHEAIVDVLLRISDMVAQLPEIMELDINPLFANKDGVMAVDARISVEALPADHKAYQHMAIHPFPNELAHSLETHTGLSLFIRPIRPEDAKLGPEFMKNLSERSRYLRFMNSVQTISPQMLSRFTQIDYDREMSFIATATNSQGQAIEAGVTRYTTNPDGKSCEMSIVVRDDFQKQGVASALLSTLIKHAKSKGLQKMTAEVLTENNSMLALVKHFNFKLKTDPEDKGVMQIEYDLTQD